MEFDARPHGGYLEAMKRFLALVVAVIAAVSASPIATAGTGGTDPDHVKRDPNPCLDAAQAKKLLCPTLSISKPYDLYYERRSSGHRVLRATSSLNSVGKGPVELHGTRTGPYSMSAVQRIYKRGGGYITVKTGARLGFKAIPG